MTESFDETHEFRGELRSASKKVEDLQFRISYSLAAPGHIKGEIIGPEALRNELSVLQTSADPFLKLKSTAPDVFGQSIYSETATISLAFTTDPRTSLLGLVGKYASDDAFVHSIAEINFQSLVVSKVSPSAETQRPCVNYYMGGDKVFWRMLLLQESNATNDPSLNERGCTLRLEDDLPFEIQLIPTDLKRWDHERELRLTKDLWLLRFTEHNESKSTEQNNLSILRRQVVDAISVAVSIATARRADWFRIEDCRGKVPARLVVSREAIRDMSSYPSAGPFNTAGSEMDFLRRAVRSYRALVADNLELEMPVDYWLRGRMSGDYRECFILIFMALERLRDMWSISKGLISILPDDAWAKLKPSVKAAIKDAVKNRKDRALIYQKIRELNRPSLRSALDKMLDHYDLTFEDLYPPSESPTFIDTRDRLIHSGNIVEPIRFYKDTVRVQSIVERLFLRMLGWTDISNAPSKFQLPKLQEPD